MPRKTISFELDFMIKDIFPRFTVKQFDDVSFNIKPKNQGLDYDTTGMTGKIFVGVDNDMFMQTTGITVSSDNINVILDKNMLQERGRAYAEIELTDSNGTITSSSFIFNIDEKIGEGAKIPEGYEGFVAKYERLISEFKSQVNSTISNCNSNVNSTIKQCNSSVDRKLNTVDSLVNAKISDLENRFNRLTSSQQQSAEVIDARDGEVSLKARLDRDLAKGKIIEEQTEGNFITVSDSIGGYIHNVEVLGNTVQDISNLSDIKSVGELQEDGTYKMSILSCGKNLFKKCEIGSLVDRLFIDFNYPTTGNYVFKFKYSSTFQANTIYIGTQSVGTVTSSGGYVNFTINITTELLTRLKNGDKLYIYRSQKDIVSPEDIQVEIGTQSTTYEPYQGNKCDILLPCQLEKIGNVADRLYYDDVEKAWCIEKNVGNYTFSGNENWVIASTLVNTSRYRLSFADIPELNIKQTYDTIWFCNSVPVYKNSEWLTDIPLIENDNTKISIRSSIQNDLTGFKTWLSQNPTLVKYQLATPQIIKLPLSTQIQLNSFFGTTHVYMESGEVEGTIKCKIPKSLGATVQSLNNKTDILSDRIEAIEGLKDSQNMKYETDKGYLVCKETKNGVIDDLKIEGKTLVNLLPNDVVGEADNYSKTFDMPSTITIDKEYTLIPYGVSLSTSTTMTISQTSSGLMPFVINVKNTNGAFKFKCVNPDFDYSVKMRIRLHGCVVDNNVKYVILEGDHTQNPPSYFEGLMSVGEDVDKIEVLSRKEDGNLFDKTKPFDRLFSNSSDGNVYYDKANDLIVADGIHGDVNSKTQAIKLEKNTTYTISYKSVGTKYRLGIKDSNVIIKEVPSPVSEGIITFTTTNGDITISMIRENTISSTPYGLKDFMLVKGNTPKPYTPHQSDKKQILFYNSNGELEPVTELHEWDSIEKHSDNKWYYHKRSEKMILDENGEWGKQSTIGDYTSFYIKPSKPFKAHTNLFCTHFNFYTGAWNPANGKEGVTLDINGNIYIQISNSKLSTQDVEGFKQWLQANNVTLVYQLAEEEVYELAPLHLDSYANETLILCNSGAISPHMEFSITSHISELVKAYGERINLLEEKVYKYMVAQNRLQLASTYSADSVTFKVDYALCSEGEEEYNNDLYDLILNNILVGKDNYDYDKMFNIILDYASWNQISWEQFDILVGLMDMQHNPPIEELPTEDEIEEDIIEEETPVE